MWTPTRRGVGGPDPAFGVSQGDGWDIWIKRIPGEVNSWWLMVVSYMFVLLIFADRVPWIFCMDLWAEIVEGVGFGSFLYYMHCQKQSTPSFWESMHPIESWIVTMHQAPSDRCLKCYPKCSGETGFIIHTNRDQTWNYCILACDSCVGMACTRLGTPYGIPFGTQSLFEFSGFLHMIH